ncbi:hypothetical protein DFH08DRAFT_811719 [Mycena albidolilacea]|uniref:Uncharacterized protein n=1 Tax=Mycena albidolilacea TaxID=1033008 RepID=A0AAD6ZWX2_9AGAR|nr:hypothetical protein DFH08DRAFT_811719 [Mycena albidolilacea]
MDSTITGGILLIGALLLFLRDQCDIEGVAYLANLLLGIIVMYDSKEVSQAVWTQLVTVYSLLISASIVIGTNGLSRFHSEMTVLLVLSPLLLALVYVSPSENSQAAQRTSAMQRTSAARRTSAVQRTSATRRTSVQQRTLMRAGEIRQIATFLLALIHTQQHCRIPRWHPRAHPERLAQQRMSATQMSGFLAFTTLADNNHFTAASPCDPLANSSVGITVLYDSISLPYFGVPLVILSLFPVFKETGASNSTAMAVVIGTIVPVILVVIALIYAVIKLRYELTKRVRHRMRNINIHSLSNFRVLWLMFWAYWDAFERRYPFLHFCSVFLVPMMYWVMLNELQLWATPDNIFTPSFGQVLALFVVLPPLVQVLMLIPKVYRRWFRNLTVIQLFF